MSLMGTLAKVAIGVALAKGAGSLMKQGGATNAGTGGLFGGASSQNTQGGSTGLEGMMGSILGGKGQQGGGIGGLMEQLGGSGTSGAASGGGLDDLIGGLTGGGSGGLGDLLGNLTSGKSGAGGGLGDLLGGLTGGTAGGGGLGGLLGGLAGATAAGSGGSFSDVLNQSFERGGEPELAPTPQQDATAGLMLRAIIQAAKSDGNIDESEKEKLLGNLKDATPEEMDFVREELSSPVDVQGFARQVPQGLEKQVYSMSVMGITLDNKKEAEYLHDLASAMGLDQREVNHIHDQLGVPALYA